MRRSISLRKDWEQIKVKVMHEIVQTESEQRGQILMAVRSITAKGSRRWIRAVYAGNNGKREERYACTAGGKIKADYQ